MLTILINAGLACAVWIASRRPEEGDRRVVWLARSLAAVGLLACALLSSLGLYFAALACDESCDSPPYSDWTGNPDAGQWTAQMPIVALGSGCVLLALVVCGPRQDRRWNAYSDDERPHLAQLISLELVHDTGGQLQLSTELIANLGLRPLKSR